MQEDGPPVRRVPVRYGASSPLASARKGVRFNSAPGAYSPGRRREHGSNCIRPARFDSPNVGIFDEQTDLGLHDVLRSRQRLRVRPSHAGLHR